MGEQREHLPLIPTYGCTACPEPWPCATARAALLEEFVAFPTVLLAYMCGHLDAAWGCALGLNGDELADRFTGWTRPAHAA